ncbi:MAG: 2Fe-2S iron-sulfur cluster binding domain-containing protein [Deltaproteobacteria bacterium]|nr:2Fe-2S iron-sulfur cluster binding domain-containing protein [Deltaproteobacteria bacterium]
MIRVTYQPLDKTVEARPGDNLFDLAQRERVPISTACVGKGTCGLCRVKIVSGGELLSPVGALDKKHIGNVYFITKVRLSCQAVLNGDGDVVVEVPDFPKPKPR